MEDCLTIFRQAVRPVAVDCPLRDSNQVRSDQHVQIGNLAERLLHGFARQGAADNCRGANSATKPQWVADVRRNSERTSVRCPTWVSASTSGLRRDARHPSEPPMAEHRITTDLQTGSGTQAGAAAGARAGIRSAARRRRLGLLRHQGQRLTATSRILRGRPFAARSGAVSAAGCSAGRHRRASRHCHRGNKGDAAKEHAAASCDNVW